MTQIVRRVAALSRQEQSDRRNLESRIDRALKYHLEAAKALREIRDRRLYRDEYDNFEDYCAARWHIARSHANRLCDWAEVAENLSPIGDNLPVRESHARPLARLTPQQQKKAWRRIMALPRHTEQVIDQVCEEVRQRPVNGNGPVVTEADKEGLPSPLPWFGGKGTMAQKIVGLLGGHEVYVEPFFGGGSVFFAKVPAKLEIVNDVHGGVVNFFRVLRDQKQAIQLQRLLQLTPYGREEHDWCRDNPEDADPVERARRFVVRVRQSYGCEEDGSWARTLDPKRSRVAEWCACVDRLHSFWNRLRQVQIECLDFRELLPDCDRHGTVIYADPPYPLETRTRNGSPYQHDMTEKDHADLLDLVCRCRHAKVVVSGYDSNLYNARLRKWRRYEFRQSIKSSFKHDDRPKRTEVVWVSP